MTELVKTRALKKIEKHMPIFQALANGKAKKEIMADRSIQYSDYNRLLGKAKAIYGAETTTQLIANMIRGGIIK